MRIQLFAAMVVLTTITAFADTTQLAGYWSGQVDTDIGDMVIALELRVDQDKLVGLLRTGHGAWPLTTSAEKSGEFSLTFDTGEGMGTMSGRIEGKRFFGRWQNPKAKGTFDVERSKHPGGGRS